LPPRRWKCAPSSTLTYAPISVPTNNTWALRGCWRTTLTGSAGNEPWMARKLSPPSSVRNRNGLRRSSRYPVNDTKATFSSWREASTRLTQRPCTSAGNRSVSSVHRLPSSRVSQTLPSSVPTQSMPAVLGDSAIVVIVQWGTSPRRRSAAAVVRSGLTMVQSVPRLRERCRYWLPAYRVCGLCAETTKGVIQLKRSAGEPLGALGRIEALSPVRRSSLPSPPNCDSE